jgi:hypothetical protein
METKFLTTFKKFTIRQNEDGFVCLTDLWKASNKTRSRDPGTWRINSGKRFIAYEQNKASKKVIISGSRLGTYATPAVALEYAKYLNFSLYDVLLSALKKDSQQAPTAASSHIEALKEIIANLEAQEADQEIDDYITIKGYIDHHGLEVPEALLQPLESLVVRVSNAEQWPIEEAIDGNQAYHIAVLNDVFSAFKDHSIS